MSAAIAFGPYHTDTLPELIAAGRGALAAIGARALEPIAFRIAETGESFTYDPAPGSIRVTPGDEAAATVVGLSESMWSGLAGDLESAPGLVYGGHVEALRGDMMDFVRWEPSLRALYQGRPLYDPEAPLPEDANGRPIDPHRSFGLADADEDMAAFLRAAGYLIVRDVFSSDEVAELLDDAEQLRAAAVPGSEESWWARHESGESRVCRVLRGGLRPRLRGLHEDPRIARLGGLPDEDLEVLGAGDVDGCTVLFKQPGMVEGLSDLPWHRDCGMGGHAVMCPAVNCSIHLGPVNEAAGDLRFLPGSQHCSVPFANADDEGAPTGVSVDARPGDVTLHYGDVVHAAPPPMAAHGPFRTTVLLSFKSPDFEHHRGGRHYNDALFQGDGNDVPDMRTMARRT